MAGRLSAARISGHVGFLDAAHVVAVASPVEEVVSADNRELIVDQFTRQAAQFARSPLVNAEHLVARIMEAAEIHADDSALDCGCGPGVMACAFAERVRHATGIDVTVAMLKHARTLQAERGLRNVAWVRGDCYALPFAAGQFSLVFSRFTLHHLPDPAAAVREMARVCRPHGRIVLADMAPASDKAEALDAMERLRDPSHVRLLPPAALVDLLTDAGFEMPRLHAMRLEGDLDLLLSRSYPADSDRGHLRRRYEESIVGDPLDMALRREGGRIVFAWPLAIVTATAAGTRSLAES